MKVVILANSLAYYDHENRWYDVRDLVPQEMYPSILAKRLWPHKVKVIAFPWMTVSDALDVVERSRSEPTDVFVLHVGIVECVRRIYPIPLRRIFNDIKLRKVREWLNGLEELLLRLPINMEGWIRPADFGKILLKLCVEVRNKLVPELLILVTINHVDKDFEVKHPGTNRNILLHNRQITNVARECELRIIPAHQVLERHFFLADSIHLNRLGHRFMADQIANAIRTYSSLFDHEPLNILFERT